MKMADNPMPLLYINLGAEMLYVLDQRLRSVGTDKAGRVLTDLINHMFKPETLQKYYRPSACNLTLDNLKADFKNIATSSIMRLNQPSMDKLFDLMVMTVKYQLHMLIVPEHLVTLTVNHLDGILSMFQDQVEIWKAVEHAHDSVLEAYYKAPSWELYLLRCEMLTYFQNCRIKCSLLVRAGKQNDEGYFINSKEGLTVSDRTDSPGFVRYFEDTILTRTEEFPRSKPGKRIEISRDDLRLMHLERMTDLGSNMYRKEQEENAKDDAPNIDEAYLLSAIMTRGDNKENNFDFSLFDNVEEESQYAEQTAAIAAAINAVHIDASKTKKSLSSAMSEMKTGGGAKKGKGADLLDMLDEAAARPPTGAPKKRVASKSATRGKSPASADGTRPTTRKATRPSTDDGSAAAETAARPSSKSATRPASKGGAEPARPTSKGAARPASKDGAKKEAAGAIRPGSKGGGARPPSGAGDRARSASVKKRTPPA